MDDLAERFRAAAVEYDGASPLYRGLALKIAGDPGLLALADAARQRVAIPHLFMAAVHYLLAKEVSAPLRAGYPSLGGKPGSGDPFPLFRHFCLTHAADIRLLLEGRLVQTNEVRRASCLLPAFCQVATRGGGRPLALIELGTSAGLLLLFDQYAYDYGDGRVWGDPHSPVHIDSALRGRGIPPLSQTTPRVVHRIGVDLQPLDVRDPDSAAWLKALVWPDELDRLEVLQGAISLAQTAPPRLVAGDALELLPGILSELPPDCTVCVFRAFTPGLSQERLTEILAIESQRREAFLVRISGAMPAQMTVSHFERGLQIEEQLAYCDAHGEWLEWVM